MNKVSAFWGISLLVLLLELGIIFMGFRRLTLAEQDANLSVSIYRQDLHTDSLLQQESLLAQANKTVRLAGTYQSDKTLLQANSLMFGKSGYYVFTPLALRTDQGKTIIALRGWIPSNDAKSVALIKQFTPKHELIVHGRLEVLPEVSSLAMEDSTSSTRNYIRIDDFYGKSNPNVLPLIVREMYGSSLSAEERRGSFFKMNWPEINSNSAKYRRQGMVLFAIAGAIFLCYIWFTISRRRQVPFSRVAL
jgi:cytochrome oxidase assembly protein ShyY1